MVEAGNHYFCYNVPLTEVKLTNGKEIKRLVFEENASATSPSAVALWVRAFRGCAWSMRRKSRMALLFTVLIPSEYSGSITPVTKCLSSVAKNAT